MIRLVVVIAIASGVASGCGGGHAAAPPAAESVDAPTVAATTEPPPTDASAPARAQRPVRALSAIELRRIREVAARVERGLAIFDRRTRSCTGGNRARCIDTAWQGIVGDVLGSEWDLTAFRDLPRGCASLDAAIDAILGFNLGARQIDYGPPGEVDAASRLGERLALVDTLRPIPSELRASATAPCRS